MPFCHAELRASKPKSSLYPKQLNTLGDHIRSRRLDLDLFQSQVAQQIGVDETTIHNWEGNKSLPSIRFFPAILRFLEYYPFPPPQTLRDRLAVMRKMLGLSQRELAGSLGVDPSSLRDWEAGQHKPIGRNVELIERFLMYAARHREMPTEFPKTQHENSSPE